MEVKKKKQRERDREIKQESKPLDSCSTTQAYLELSWGLGASRIMSSAASARVTVLL